MTDAPNYASPAPASNPDSYPGKTLGIVGLVLAFLFSLAGIIVSAIALKQSKDAGYKNTPAKIGLILSIIFFIISVIATIAIIAGSAALVGAGMEQLTEVCQGLEPGTPIDLGNGQSVECP